MKTISTNPQVSASPAPGQFPVELTITPGITATPTPIQDQGGNVSGLYLTDQNTGTVHVGLNGRFVLGVSDADGGGEGEWIQNANFGIAFFGLFEERMRLTNTGLLGIGTQAPSATLDVNGDVHVSGDITFGQSEKSLLEVLKEQQKKIEELQKRWK